LTSVPVAVGLRRRVKIGPALHIAPVPVATLTLSAGVHIALLILGMMAVNAIKASEPKTYIVNLVPAVAAIGSPQGQASAPPAPKPAPPRPPEPATKEQPAPPAPKPVAPRPPEPVAKDPAPPRDLPPRDLPPRTATRDSMSLPDRSLPARSASTPTPPPRRVEQKELPAVASAKSPVTTAPPPSSPPPTAPTTASTSSTAPPVPPAAAAPPQPLGQPTGSPVGAGKLTLDVDFPYAWYLRVLVNKINERWDGQAMPGNQPLVVFEIDKSGGVNVGRVRIEKSSGNPAYDRVALRAIAESSPFPPLPTDFNASYLRVHLQFDFTRGG
jgi:TonB family protein